MWMNARPTMVVVPKGVLTSRDHAGVNATLDICFKVTTQTVLVCEANNYVHSPDFNMKVIE